MKEEEEVEEGRRAGGKCLQVAVPGVCLGSSEQQKPGASRKGTWQFGSLALDRN